MARAGEGRPLGARLRGRLRDRRAAVSRVTIPADPLPFHNHRTWREVMRTEELTAKADAGHEKMTRQEFGEFGNLLIKARRNNPPPDDQVGAA